MALGRLDNDREWDIVVTHRGAGKHHREERVAGVVNSGCTAPNCGLEQRVASRRLPPDWSEGLRAEHGPAERGLSGAASLRSAASSARDLKP